ncbi:ENDO3c domain protein [Mollivirus kamchatka]|nr:ENDO3c domain protein [Mollivirus kamchatka]
MNRNASKAELALCKLQPAFVKVLAFHKGSLDTLPFVKDAFSSLVRAIIGQRIALDKAQQLYGALMESLAGRALTPNAMLSLGEARLGGVLRHKSKAATIVRVSKYIVDESIRLSSPRDVLALLCVKGIGKWTVHNAVLSTWPAYDLFPSGDYFLQRKLQKLLGLDHLPSPEEATKIAVDWAPYRGTATWLLWRWFEDTRYDKEASCIDTSQKDDKRQMRKDFAAIGFDRDEVKWAMDEMDAHCG